MFRRRIYLDYASLTPIDRRVLRVMKKLSSKGYANPSSIYKEGVKARKVLEESRKVVSRILGGRAEEIFFTSGGTEANNLAVLGTAQAVRMAGRERPHLIISAVEHSSIIECANLLEKLGMEVTRLAVDSFGSVSLEELKKAIRPETFLVSIMMVNNEIGTVQKIREIAKIIRHSRTNLSTAGYQSPLIDHQSLLANHQFPLFHTDASQAPLFYDLKAENLGVDLLTIDGGKIYGPRGIGAIYVKKGTPISPVLVGGGQEKGLRSGTENLPAIAGLAKALELADRDREKEFKRVSELKAFFLAGLRRIRPDLKVNGHSDPEVSPHILNISLPGIDNEFFLLRLDAKGVAVSTKSSCLRDSDQSYVLRAIGADSGDSLRFSFGRWTTKREIKAVLALISLF